ncbi:hypothetical protein E4U42_000767 [Claviceps africana]|uniref:Uncharacterized protein n=1 Tax=Claviceps africana TaxID=83212 RepID=A0A8K0JA43_9HYPO|nr:hypothetical protein E4U42_000767 [Claviceps africana]
MDVLSVRSPTPEDVHEAFDALPRFDIGTTRAYFNTYLDEALPAILHELPTVVMLHSTDMDVKIVTGRRYYYLADLRPCPSCFELERRVEVERYFEVDTRSFHDARNFMGYVKELESYVFRGARRLMGSFLDTAAAHLLDGEMMLVYFQPEFVLDPVRSQGPYIGFNEFADYAEHWTCVIMLRPGLEKDPLKLDDEAATSKVEPDAEEASPEAEEMPGGARGMSEDGGEMSEDAE